MYEVLSLNGDLRSISEKFIDLSTNLREDIHEDKYHDTDKYDIESRDDDIRSSIFPSEHMDSVDLSCHSPVMDLCREVGTKLQEYIRKKKCDEKKYQEITQCISYNKEKTIGDNLLPKEFTEDDGECGF